MSNGLTAWARNSDGVTARRVNDNEITREGPANVFTAGISLDIRSMEPWLTKDEDRFYRRSSSYSDAWKVCGYFFTFFWRMIFFTSVKKRK